MEGRCSMAARIYVADGTSPESDKVEFFAMTGGRLSKGAAPLRPSVPDLVEYRIDHWPNASGGVLR